MEAKPIVLVMPERRQAMRLLRTVNHNLFLISVLLSMIYCISCNSKQDNTLTSEDEYLLYVYYDDTDWCEKCKCQKVLTKDILFSFDTDFTIDLSSIDYEFLIIRQGVIYRGPFENNIIIDNLTFCMDDNLSKVNTLAFALLDHTNKLVYKWYNKESYYLYKKDKYHISLKGNGDFSLR